MSFDENDLEIDIHFSGKPTKSTKIICRKRTSVCSNCMYLNLYNECPIGIEVSKLINKDTFYCTDYKERK